MDARIVNFDPKTARFALPGNTPISFADPMTARAAGYIVAPRPGPVCGVVTVVPGEPVLVLRRPAVICAVAGTDHNPPPSAAAREVRAVMVQHHTHGAVQVAFECGEIVGFPGRSTVGYIEPEKSGRRGSAGRRTAP